MVEDTNSGTATFNLGLLLGAIEDLKSRGLMARRVISTFFSCRVLPLKMRSYPQWEFQGVRGLTIQSSDPICVEELCELMMAAIGLATLHGDWTPRRPSTHYYTNGLLSRLPTPFLSRFWNRDKASGTKASSRVAEPGQKVLDVKIFLHTTGFDPKTPYLAHGFLTNSPK